MEPFSLQLSNGGVVPGAKCIPPPFPTTADSKPLIVALHGGSYDHKYFDATPKYSAANTSKALGVPFVAIDRPSHGGTSSILPVPEGSSVNQESGTFIHKYILPKLWSEFGVPNACNCIVLLCHSMGSMSGIVAAALRAEEDNEHQYPLGGIIASRMGDRLQPWMNQSPLGWSQVDEHMVQLPSDRKDDVLLPSGTAAEEVLQQVDRLNAPAALADLMFSETCIPVWQARWAGRVSVPVSFAMVKDDCFFVVNEEYMQEYRAAFKSSRRVDVSLLNDAPHCIELSYWSQGWYARCFGFALECAADMHKLHQQQ